ncbi:MAG TPA: hypothetical protein VFG54_12245 [Prolixibacteraceae bacterium]|nr:hypothetical protein [Prolixibacteraceae bacterium]
MKPEVFICPKVERKNINSTGDFEVLNTESAILTLEMKESRAGKYGSQRLDIIADIEDDIANDLQRIPQLFRLTNSEDKVFPWGDTVFKSRCTSCVRNGVHTRITFSRVSKSLVL